MSEVRLGDAVIVKGTMYGRIVEFPKGLNWNDKFENNVIISTPHGMEVKTSLVHVHHLKGEELKDLLELERVVAKDPSYKLYNGKCDNLAK